MTTEADYKRLVHSLAHSWRIWSHHIDPFYVCGDDTFDTLYGLIPEADYERVTTALFESLAAHGIPTESNLQTAAEYGCPEGIPMAPEYSTEEIKASRVRFANFKARMEART